jgi:hypothetical protein
VVSRYSRVTMAKYEPRMFSGDPRHHPRFGTDSSPRGQQKKNVGRLTRLSNIVELVNPCSGFIRTENGERMAKYKFRFKHGCVFAVFCLAL